MARPEDATFDEDDDALHWAGDEEQGRAAPRLGSERAAAGETATETEEDDEPEAPGAGGRRAATVGFAVPYLALTIGWILSAQYLTSGGADALREVLWQFGEFLAMLSAPVWFAATLSLTRGSRPLVRVGWLALGLGVLLPWPVLLRLVASLFFAGSVS